MYTPAKVLWGEGQHLRPQHFQQQDRYHEARLAEMAAALHPWCWGVRKLELDADALKADMLRVLELSLIFPDGEIVHAPGPDALPPPVSLGALPPEPASLTFHAVLPALRPQGGNCAPRGGTPDDGVRLARYGQRECDTADLFGDAAPAPVAVLTRSLRLRSDLDIRDAHDSLPLLRLRRTVAGGFEVDAAFMPPSLSIDSAPVLCAQLARLVARLLAKVHALYEQYREPGRNVVELRGGDFASFWLLHTVSCGHAALNHYLVQRELHPECLFREMLVLAGGLTTFSRRLRLEDLPTYSHQDPGPAFARLDAILRELLDTVIPPRYVAIALRGERPSYYLGALDAARIDAQASLYLGVTAALPALQLAELVPLRFKLGAPDDVDKLVLSAMPGVRLVHATRLPAALPPRPGALYFALEQRGVLYQAMRKAQSISIYVPNGIPDLQLELIAIPA